MELMKHKDIKQLIEVVFDTIPKIVELTNDDELYGSKEYDIFYGINEKHASFKRFKNNVKRILWRKS